MTNKEFRKQMDDRTEDLIVQIQRHEDTIANIVKSAYERGYADGKDSKALSNEIITTFGRLMVGDKFKICGGITTYIKTVTETKYLAYDTETSRCIFLQDDFPVILIMDGDEV